jgi:hypothetical protein
MIKRPLNLSSGNQNLWKGDTLSCPLDDPLGFLSKEKVKTYDKQL